MINPKDRPPFAQDDSLFEDLRSAYEPDSIDSCLNEPMIEAALQGFGEEHSAESGSTLESEMQHPAPTGCNDATDVDRDDARALAEALTNDEAHPLAVLASALRDAYAPAELDPSRGQDILRRALTRGERAKPRPIRVRWSYVSVVTAMAAGIALWLVRSPNRGRLAEDVPEPQFAQSRSVGPLFVESLGSATATERIDRIYAVRSRELRHNRYATWRVR